MKRLIRNKTTRQYLQEDGTWGSTEDALDFDSMSDVIKFVQNGSFTDVELVLTIEDKPSEYDITLDLSRSRSPSKQASPAPRSAAGL